jgi:VirE N-terminal domain
LVFISPRGNGLKVVIAFNLDFENVTTSHNAYFKALQNYFMQEYKIAIDQSCSDVSRACFMSHDENAFYGENESFLNNEFLDKYSQVPQICETQNPEFSYQF